MSVISLSKNYTGFDPRTIPGCALWLDAADSSTFTLSGSSITAWRDKSGNSNSPTFSANKPTYVNGYVLTSNGNQQFTVPAATLSQSAGGSGTIFFVYKDLQTPAGIYRILFANNSGYLWQSLLRPDSLSYQLNNVVVPALSTALNNTNILIYCMSYTYGSSVGSVQVNGTTYVTSYSPTIVSPSGPLVISGFTSGGVDNANIQLYETITYTTTLTTSQRQLIEGYLAWKWGLLSSLPGTHPYKTTPLFTRPFQPTDILGCSLWLDAADASSLTLSGSSVTQWNDKSGNGYNATPYSTFGNATVSTGYQNNNNVLNFSGNNLYRTATNAAVYPVDAYMVLSLKSGVTSANILSLTQGSGTNNWTSFSIGAYSSARWNQSSPLGARSYDTNTTETTPTSFLLMNWTLANNNFSIRRNTTTIGSTTSFTWSLPSNPSFCIGFPYISDATGPFNVYMGEIVIFNSVLSTSQRQQVEGYLANKWGLRSSLPSTQPFKLFPPLTTLFNPLNLSGCQLWLDAADASTLTLSGSNVTQWNDKSGNGRNGTAFNSSPTYSSSKKSIDFDGTQGLTTSLTASTNIESGFVVASFTNVTLVNTMLGCYESTGGRQFRVYAQQINTIKQGISNVLSTGATLSNNITYLCEYTNNGTTLNHYLTGSSYASGTSVAYNAGLTTAIGSRFDSSNPSSESMRGSIFEILIFNSDLSTSQRQQVEGYLASKWGLQPGLPSTHPFKRITP
jgi:hypothetical protein